MTVRGTSMHVLDDARQVVLVTEVIGANLQW
jgi:hypothetical protein